MLAIVEASAHLHAFFWPNLLVGLPAQELQRWRIQQNGSVGAWGTQTRKCTKPRTTRGKSFTLGGHKFMTKDTAHSDCLCQWAIYTVELG